jgi:hypothetical protein
MPPDHPEKELAFGRMQLFKVNHRAFLDNDVSVMAGDAIFCQVLFQLGSIVREVNGIAIIPTIILYHIPSHFLQYYIIMRWILFNFILGYRRRFCNAFYLASTC